MLSATMGGLRAAGGVLMVVVGAACLLTTAAGFALGARPLVVRTGSMEPTLPVGTVVVARPAPATDAAVGDVVAVVRSDGKRILHRVERSTPAGGDAVTLVLRGDRNQHPDPPLTVSKVERPVLTVPFVGRIVTWLQGPWAQYWLGVLTGAAATVLVARQARRRVERPVRARGA